MVEFPVLMRTYIKQQIAMGDPDDHNFIRLRHGEYVPDVFNNAYEMDSVKPCQVLRETRRAMEAHGSFQFLRSGAVIYAINKCRELGLVPMKFKPSTLPGAMKGTHVDNYAKVIQTFHIFYCKAQSLSRTSEEAREALVYLFHGFGVFKSKLHPCIPIIHKKIQTGMHRLTAMDKIEKYVLNKHSYSFSHYYFW